MNSSVYFLFAVKARPGLCERLERPTLQVGKTGRCGVVPVGRTASHDSA